MSFKTSADQRRDEGEKGDRVVLWPVCMWGMYAYTVTHWHLIVRP